MNLLEFKLLLAESEFTPKKVFELLAKDKNWIVHVRLAKNPNVPKKILKMFVEDKDWLICSFIAQNPNAPKKIIDKIAKRYNIIHKV